MNDQLRASDPEEIITCPYEEVHQVTRKRMQNHLERCRKQHYELAKVMATCPFNFAHKVPKLELDLHEEICTHRDSLYSFTYSLVEPNETVQDVLKNTETELYIPTTESWDTDPPVEQVITNVEKSAEQRGILRNYQNMPPSERKAKREEDRLKMLQRRNAEDQTRQNPKNWSSTSVVSTASVAASTVNRAPLSSGSRSTATDAMSDMSFNTALNNASSRLEKFQLVTKKSRGRASQIPPAEPSNALAGIGRGRRPNN